MRSANTHGEEKEEEEEVQTIVLMVSNCHTSMEPRSVNQTKHVIKYFTISEGHNTDIICKKCSIWIGIEESMRFLIELLCIKSSLFVDYT